MKIFYFFVYFIPKINVKKFEMKIIVITGTTATGKTEVSIELAHKINGEIVSADSMMVYRHMDIGTAKPTLEERKGIQHYLIDVVDPDYDFSVKDFIEMADQSIKKIKGKGKVPIIVGGSWLYIHALIYGLTDAPPTDWKLREKLYKKDSNHLFEELIRVDPEYASKIHKNDKKRIIRALEVYIITGKPFSYFHKKHRFREKRYDFVGFVFERERKDLMDRIQIRVDAMFRKGLVDEVKKLLDLGYENTLTAKQAIGYKEVIPYIKGQITLEEAKKEVIKNTKDFAKRQIRTFRSKLKEDKNWEKIDLLEELKEEGKEVVIYLTRGTRITGKILASDQFTILLDVNGEKQLVYKHAISTIVAET